jgi:hypothetical protein
VVFKFLLVISEVLHCSLSASQNCPSARCFSATGFVCKYVAGFENRTVFLSYILFFFLINMLIVLNMTVHIYIYIHIHTHIYIFPRVLASAFITLLNRISIFVVVNNTSCLVLSFMSAYVYVFHCFIFARSYF